MTPNGLGVTKPRYEGKETKSMNGLGKGSTHPARKTAMRFVILLGVVSLFADMTYEGARSITGPYLGLLGASATAVGFIAGFGELIGYGFRLVSGYLSDHTGRYWAFTLAGYALNLLVAPLLALAGRWEIAATLIIAERVGKALRTPARDAMLSHATKEMGRGWGFGLHEAMDQIGAMLGPLIVAAVLAFQGSYETGFVILLMPALLSAFFAPLVFTSSFYIALVGMTLWGVSMGAQESVMRAAVGGMVSPDRRGAAYGIFNSGYGLAWFAGSALMGILYDISLPALITFSIIIQLVAVPMLYRLTKERAV